MVQIINGILKKKIILDVNENISEIIKATTKLY